ncbi:rhamnulokinase family protein [Humibacter soli]
MSTSDTSGRLTGDGIASGRVTSGGSAANASVSVAAVDLGATSGRVIVGRVADGRVELRHIARFPNDPVQLTDGLHWNIVELYRQVLAGLAAARSSARESGEELAAIGIDSWAVDYALMRGDRMLGVPFHYRDERTAAGVASVHARIGADELYRRNGLQHLPFNTVFQLACDADDGAGTPGLLDLADRMLLIPDLLAFWLTGERVAERTNASTTGLLDPVTREWDVELAERLDIPTRLLPPLVEPGAHIGTTSLQLSGLAGDAVPVIAVGSHDTASAVVAVPAQRDDFAYISCGTWGLVGLELEAPVVAEQARLAGFTNEGGVDGRIRFLHNVMGLWLLSESIRSWELEANAAQRSSSLQELLDAAARVTGPVTIFDVDDPRFLPPGDIPSRIVDWCDEHGVAAPSSQPEFVRSIVESLAQAFADTVRAASDLAEKAVSVIHIVGGGAQNTMLCQSTADRSGLPVIAGPVEATAVGNVLVQARALAGGGIAADATLDDLREIVARSFDLVRYEPSR